MTRAALDIPRLVIETTEENHEYDHLAGSEISIFCHDKEFPSFIASEMENLYESLFSSFAKFSALKEEINTRAYVVRSAGKISTVFLFRHEERRVHVLNEFISVGNEEMHRFSNHIFSKYKKVDVISFRAIKLTIQSFSYPYQRHNCIEDIVLSLPGSVQKYQTSLGKNMRKNIKTHLDRIRREYPSFSFTIYSTPEVNEHHVRSIIQFNRERRAGKNKMSGIDEVEAQKFVNLVKACGLVAVVTIDGKICAGKLFFKVGANYFSLLNAHSPDFNEYRLGTLCNYLSICECIDRGGKEFHFLWGREEFKYRFLGEQRDLDELVIYRSPLHMARHGRLAVKTAINGRARQARLWLLDPKRKDHFAVRFAKKTLQHLRSQTH